MIKRIDHIALVVEDMGQAQAVFRLFKVPVGMIIGGLMIWYLLQQNVAAQFGR